MSIASFFSNLFHTASADFAKAEAAAKTADNFIGVLLGEAEAVSGVVALIDPAIGTPILTGLAAVEAGRAALKAALATDASNVSAITTQVVTLTSQSMDLAVQLAPFFKVIANDAQTAAAAAKAQAGVVKAA